MMLLAIVLALGASVPLASGNTVTASATATNTTTVSSMNKTSTARATASVDVSMGSSPSNACSAPIEVGRCRAAVPRWAFSAEDGRCTRFTYGGCGGNDNNFGSRRLCEAECGKPEPEPEPNPVCELTPAVVGRCRAAFRRWTYRAKSRQCESFIYGGCGGNDNNFESEAECEAACEVAPPPADVCELDIVPGPCKALFPSWGFDGEHCVEFNYGGCQGNANRFETEEECEAACGAAPPPPDVCELDIVVGPCEALIPSWGFDGDHCVEFNYGGCEGNGNRFETEEECEAACEAAPPPTDACELDIVVGPCEAAIKSWGFDGDHCVEFLYGGCGGNDNRFETEEECEAACEVEPAPAPAPTPGPDPDICELDIVPGPCFAFFPSWGFDGKQCVEFVYGGCGGNGNRFETQADCEAACEPAGTCQLPLETGNCRAAIPRWGFDGGNCVEFTYGGCGGNGNRFETQEECEAACAEDICALPTFPPNLLIRCLAIIPAWTFRDGECTAFTYGGCGATANLFFSEEECLALCGPAAEPAPRVSANTTATAKATVTADPPTRARKARTD